MRFKKTKNTAVMFAVLVSIYVYFCNAKAITVFVKEGMLLCYNAVIPSLYIFMVMCQIISNTNLCYFISIPFIPFFNLLNIRNKTVVSYCILGILGGFATGGVMLNKIQTDFDCDSNTLAILSILLSGNSPAFVILTVGLYYLGNIYTGILIYFSILLSLLITSFFISCIFPPGYINPSKNKLGITNSIILSIKSSTYSILDICGIVTLSFCICKVISLYINIPFISLIFSIFIEVTTACEYLFSHYGFNLCLLSLILTICPLSTYLQMKSIGNNNTLNFKMLFISRIIQIPIMLLALRTLLNLFPQSVNVYSSQDISVYMHWNNPKISLYFLLLSVCFVIVTEKKLKVFTILSK